MTDLGTQADWARIQQDYPIDVRPFIDGTLEDSRSDQIVEKISPADGKPLFKFAAGSRADVDAAVASARRVFEAGTWAHVPLMHRKAILSRLAELIERDAQTLAMLETIDVGKPIRDAVTADIPLAIMVLRGAIEAAESLTGATYPSDGASLVMSLRLPRGVVSAIIGWNFPLVLAMQKIAPALITGNSIVLKPSELTSLSALHLARLAIEAGIPEGVFNVIPGLGATVGDAIAHHMDIDMLSFTGSTATGKKLLQASGASNMKRLLLECGGKSPNIVFADAPDLQQVAQGVFMRMFWNQGQVCTAGTRLIVHNSVREELVGMLEGATGMLQAGHPLSPETTLGPLISAPQRDKVMGYITEGQSAGASLRCGGGALLAESGGYYVQPTIFTDVDPDHRIAREEIFGPVLSVMGFDTEDEAIALANRTTYGLSAIAWTQSAKTAHRIMRDLNAGGVSINATGTPGMSVAFGSVPLEPHRQSGFGVEGGMEGLASYTILKTIMMSL